MIAPTPKHRSRLLPKFTISDTSRGDYHFGIIARHVSDYAQDDCGKYSASLVIIAIFKYIIQFGFTWNKSPVKSALRRQVEAEQQMRAYLNSRKN